MVLGRRIIGKLIIFLVLIATSVFLFANTALADTPTSSPHQIGFYCPPYTESFVEGGYYEIATTSGACIWQTGDLPLGSPHYGGLFRGVVGSSTGAGNFMGVATERGLNIPFVLGDPQQDEPFFGAIWEVRSGPAFEFDLPNFLNFFRNGSSPAPSDRWGVINWEWGVEPATTTPDATTTPVIIIPGILGSAQHNGVWLIDPITHAYDNLIDTLAANGYERDVTLFPFPYDWHLSNRTTATLLKEKIDEIKGICGCDKIDIVAHSMGGLVARYYIQSDNYADDVQKLIFLGTPHQGAPNAYLMWEGGERGASLTDNLLELFLLVEARKNGSQNLFDYIRNKPILSVQELLPVYGYIKHVGSSDIPPFPNSSWYPNNLFLYDLNSNIGNFYNSGVITSNFVGQLTEDKTITTIRVIPPPVVDPAAKWGFGIPEGFPDIGDGGLERGPGDKTVPISSASFINVDLRILDAEHNDLPTVTEGSIYKILTGRDPASLINESHGILGLDPRMLILKILSPADIVVIDPDGLRVGKDFATGQELHDIPDAFYSGYGTDDEYVTIPDPKGGEYKVLTQGTGSGGEYTIATGVIGEATSSTTFFTGTTLPNLITEHNVDVDPANPNETTITPADQTPPTITFIQPATTTYTHADLLPVNVTFSDDTGVASSSVLFDTSLITASSTVDLFFKTLGNHTITAHAQDFVNNAATSTKNIQVVATVSSTQSDINRAFALGWIKYKELKNVLINTLTQASKLKKQSAKIVLYKVMLEGLKLAKKTKVINQQAYDLLMADINWLMTH